MKRDGDGWMGDKGEDKIVIDQSLFCRECEERLKEVAKYQRIDIKDKSVNVVFIREDKVR